VGEFNGGVNLLNKDDLRVFVSAGAGIMILVNNREADQVFYASSNAIYTSAKSNLSKATNTLNASAGVTLKNKIVVAAAYHFPTSVGNYVYYSHMLTSLQVKVGYKF
jgi:hypothetical protein